MKIRMMVFALLLACMMLPAAGDPLNPEPFFEYAANYTYWSDVSDGVYWWAVRNESTTATLISWTTGQAFPIGTIPRAAIVPEALFPLPTVQPTLPRPWFNAFLYDDLAPIAVTSILRWSDGTFAAVPVYMPPDAPLLALQAVPEPAGLLVLAVGLVGAIRVRKGKRTWR